MDPQRFPTVEQGIVKLIVINPFNELVLKNSRIFLGQWTWHWSQQSAKIHWIVKDQRDSNCILVNLKEQLLGFLRCGDDEVLAVFELWVVDNQQLTGRIILQTEDTQWDSQQHETRSVRRTVRYNTVRRDATSRKLAPKRMLLLLSISLTASPSSHAASLPRDTHTHTAIPTRHRGQGRI